MEIKHVDFYFFSGTGNTYLVVKKMAEVFREKNVSVKIHRMEKTDPEKINTDVVVGLAFPVAFQSTYPFVWKFIDSLPKAQKMSVFMVDTLAAMSGGIVGPLRKTLENKGYWPVGSKEIKMPSNFHIKSINEQADREKMEKGLKEAEEYAESILDGSSTWAKQGIFADLMYTISRSDLVKFFIQHMAKDLKVDLEKCKKCGTCAKLCPVGNIKMDVYPRYRQRCELCMRCVAVCPVDAIRHGNSAIYRAAKPNNIINP